MSKKQFYCLEVSLIISLLMTLLINMPCYGIRFERIQFDTALELKTICDGSFVKDQDGFLWIGCQTNLFRFNGTDFKSYSANIFFAPVL